MCQDTGDVGAFYIGRDWTSQGHIIKYNYWHDITGMPAYSFIIFIFLHFLFLFLYIFFLFVNRSRQTRSQCGVLR